MNISDLSKGHIIIHPFKKIPVIITKNYSSFLDFISLKVVGYSNIGETGTISTYSTNNINESSDFLEIRFEPKGSQKIFSGLKSGDFIIHPTYKIPCMVYNPIGYSYVNSSFKSTKDLVVFQTLPEKYIQCGDVCCHVYDGRVLLLTPVFSNEVSL